MKTTYLEKLVKAFLKDEYKLSDVDVSVNVTSATGKPPNTKRLDYDASHEFDFDLID